jgi:hypothetical protein
MDDIQWEAEKTTRSKFVKDSDDEIYKIKTGDNLRNF